MAIYLIEFVRNFFNDAVLPWHVSLFLLYIEQACQFIVFTLICYFFIHAASKLVGKERVQKWEQRLKLYLIVIAVVLFVFGLIIFTPLLDSFFQDKTSYGCKRDEFWIQDLILLLIILGFMYAANVITKAITA